MTCRHFLDRIRRYVFTYLLCMNMRMQISNQTIPCDMQQIIHQQQKEISPSSTPTIVFNSHEQAYFLRILNMSTPHPQTIPYFVLRLNDGRAKVLFTVPSALAQSLSVNPVLCRGASFDLEIDRVSLVSQPQSSTTTSFLSTEFDSPTPEETARAISERIAFRIGSPSLALSHFFGGVGSA